MDRIGHAIALVGGDLHPLHNKRLHRFLVEAYGIEDTIRILEAAASQCALHRRRHMLAILNNRYCF